MVVALKELRSVRLISYSEKANCGQAPEEQIMDNNDATTAMTGLPVPSNPLQLPSAKRRFYSPLIIFPVPLKKGLIRLIT
jgi:hypothetical protein